MPETDEQDQSETFDETHLDDEGDTGMLLDELDPVFDATQAVGDSDVDDDEDDGDEESDEAEDGLRQRETLEAEADALLNAGETEGDDDGEPRGGPDEIELVYTGLMREQRGAQASAAHWEAKRLADDDIASLGYAPDEAPQTPETPR
ncbi:MAG: hypothetical protein KJ676_02185 [Alphaproteobacteria bacterium]|nr:hypothetical protein [Alphaproteobacteria bacterium]MBU1524890.1 hypothetical protein [Alphaproteobacteria bacterium]MBU2116147.1 hypothetical protein [Alphaproteobacteria bacterium]MBU2352103.1 hypothetical protein [Alphaproteobacteria bacterium]MBU2381928.1 hypothetical protein [Alphaproteobacteria bacterium]